MARLICGEPLAARHGGRPTFGHDLQPTVSYSYTRRGQRDKVTRGSDTWKLFYTEAGQLLSEAGSAGTLSGLCVTNAFDAYLRRTNVSTASSGTLLTTSGYFAAFQHHAAELHLRR